MTPDLVGFLTLGPGGPEIGRLVDAGITDRSVLAELTALRKRFSHEQSAAIVEQALLQIRAADKFANPQKMLFEREALQQATNDQVSGYRTLRIKAVDPALIVDLSVGIGGDAIALTGLAPVVGLDVDPNRLLLAGHNALTVGGPHQFMPIQGDSMTLVPFPADIVFADPARREGGRRLKGLDGYLPPVVEMVERWLPHAGSLGVKVAPGILEHEIDERASVEWISLNGRLREALMWWGELGTPGLRLATVLPSGDSLSGPEPDDIPVGRVGDYLHEPDDAVIRAGLVRVLAAEIDAHLIDTNIAYLSSDSRVDHPMCSSHRIDWVDSFNLKTLRRKLTEADIGSVTIKKRGSPLTPEELRPRLKLSGERHATVFLTRIGDRPIMAVGVDD